MPTTKECEKDNSTGSEKENRAGRKSCRRSEETVVEDWEDDDDNADTPSSPSWRPDHGEIGIGDVYRLMEQFTDALKSAGYFIAESMLWEDTADVLRRLDRGEIAPGAAMRVVKEAIRRTKRNSGFNETGKRKVLASSSDDQSHAREERSDSSTSPSCAATNPSAEQSNSSGEMSELRVVFDNIARDFGPQATQTFLIRVVSYMSATVSGLVTTFFTIKNFIATLRSDLDWRDKFLAALKVAAPTLLIGSSAHAATIEYLRTLTPDRWEEVLSDIDSYSEGAKEVLSPAALVLMAILAVYSTTLSNERVAPRGWGKTAKKIMAWGSFSWSAYGWVQSFLKLPVDAAAPENAATENNASASGNTTTAPDNTTTVQFSAGYQNVHGEIDFESMVGSLAGSVRPNKIVEMIGGKERIGVNQHLQCAADGEPRKRWMAIEAINAYAARLSSEEKAVATLGTDQLVSPRARNPLLIPADHRTYVDLALERWGNKTGQLRVIHVEFHPGGTKERPYLAKFQALQANRNGTTTTTQWDMPCNARHKEELLAAVRLSENSVPVVLSDAAQALLKPAMRFFDASRTAEDAGQEARAEGSASASTSRATATGANRSSPGAISPTSDAAASGKRGDLIKDINWLSAINTPLPGPIGKRDHLPEKWEPRIRRVQPPATGFSGGAAAADEAEIHPLGGGGAQQQAMSGESALDDPFDDSDADQSVNNNSEEFQEQATDYVADGDHDLYHLRTGDTLTPTESLASGTEIRVEIFGSEAWLALHLTGHEWNFNTGRIETENVDRIFVSYTDIGKDVRFEISGKTELIKSIKKLIDGDISRKQRGVVHNHEVDGTRTVYRLNGPDTLTPVESLARGTKIEVDISGTEAWLALHLTGKEWDFNIGQIEREIPALGRVVVSYIDVMNDVRFEISGKTALIKSIKKLVDNDILEGQRKLYAEQEKIETVLHQPIPRSNGEIFLEEFYRQVEQWFDGGELRVADKVRKIIETKILRYDSRTFHAAISESAGHRATRFILVNFLTPLASERVISLEAVKKRIQHLGGASFDVDEKTMITCTVTLTNELTNFKWNDEFPVRLCETVSC